MAFRWDKRGWERQRKGLGMVQPSKTRFCCHFKRYPGYCRCYFNPKALWGFVRSVRLGYGPGGFSLQGCFQGCALPVSTLLFHHYLLNCISETWQQSISGPEVTKDKSEKRHCIVFLCSPRGHGDYVTKVSTTPVVSFYLKPHPLYEFSSCTGERKYSF